MARIELAPEVVDDLERILDHLQRHEAAHIPDRLREIIEAISVLETNPLIGRPASRDKRELVIGRGAYGYLALYRYVAQVDTVFVLAVRSQREAGFTDR
ncbi:type II toxin-antitoxin system RelE/ParE family toxin [[Pseudomonas] boreopolis]|uniref:type II toxin-antitoxin system RelE/ParE family toxin n=1 Tax=Xanthomonas boreopolis TaxID=86183 RepID=UPI003DA1BC43